MAPHFWQNCESVTLGLVQHEVEHLIASADVWDGIKDLATYYNNKTAAVPLSEVTTEVQTDIQITYAY